MRAKNVRAALNLKSSPKQKKNCRTYALTDEKFMLPFKYKELQIWGKSFWGKFHQFSHC